MLRSSSNNWERLVAAVLKKQLIWELCHQQSRSPSFCSTISSDGLSQRILSFSGTDFEPFSVPPSPLLPPSISQGKTTAVSSNTSSRRITRILFSAWYRRRKSKRHDLVQIPAEYPEFRLGQLERYHFHQLRVATDSFSDKNLLGRGGFGTVYKGRLVGGTLVAVKRLTEEWRPPGEFQFLAQSEIISMAKQRNILRLRGFCMTPTERLLVYPYMVNGSLASYLRARPPNVPPLDWRTRKRIARGSAYGLAYLHDYWIIHHDVKAANIFLDEKFEAVVGDIGLAKPKLMDHEDADIGHMAPEYLSTGKTSEKTDVFAYGITLLELITGQSARVAKDDDVMLLDWVKRIFKEKKLETLVDSDLQNNYVEAEVEQLIQIAVLCTQSSAMGRPKMSEVVRLLGGHGLAERWDEWQKVEEHPQEVGVARVPISGRIIHPVELPGPRE